MQRQWLNVKGQIIDMEPTPAPAPAKRPRPVSRPVSAVLVAICVICTTSELAIGVYFMTHYGFFSGAPFHVAAVVMAALTWSAFKPEAYRS